MYRSIAAVVLALGLSTSPALAQAPAGQGPVPCMAAEGCQGERVSLEGTFGSHEGPGVGFTLELEDQSVLIRGLGPRWWWRQQDVQRPRPGDDLTVDAVTVDCCGEAFYVAMAITLPDETVVELRDPETGRPLWRGGRRNQPATDGS